MSLIESDEENKSTKLASSNELNSWKRGFTPQAEIWNGRMAIAGLITVSYTHLTLPTKRIV